MSNMGIIAICRVVGRVAIPNLLGLFVDNELEKGTHHGSACCDVDAVVFDPGGEQLDPIPYSKT